MYLPDPALFPKGTILNTYGTTSKNLLRRFVYAQIRRYQKKKYPRSSRTDAVHSMIHLGGGEYLSVQHPRAVIVNVQLDPAERYSFWQYRYLDHFDLAAWAAFDEAAREIRGTRYDYGQLIDILVHQLFGWLPDKLSIFDFGRRRKVCSVACHALLVKAWQETQNSLDISAALTPLNLPAQTPLSPPAEAGGDIPRPLGEQYIEHTCPADFENHGTFECVFPTTVSARQLLSPSPSRQPLSPALSPQSGERGKNLIRKVSTVLTAAVSDA